MLTKLDLLKVLADVASGEVTALLRDERYLDETMCRKPDRPLVQEIAELLHQLYVSFDYAQSPEFQREVAGKPVAFVAMKRRHAADPTRLAEHRIRLKKSLGELLTSEEAFQLVPPSHHHVLRRIVGLTYQLGNPFTS